MDSKSLLTSTVPLLEEPTDNDLTPFDVASNSIILFEIEEIVSSVGKSSFEYKYKNFIEEINKQEFNIRRDFCNSLLFQVQSVYNFEFSEKITISSEEEINNVLSFITFLEYNCFDFLVLFCKNIEMDLQKDLNLDLLSTKTLYIIEILDKLLSNNSLPIIAKELLSNLDKYKIVILLKRLINKFRNRIILSLKLMEFK